MQSLAGRWGVAGMGLAFGSLGCVTEQVTRNGDGPQDKEPRWGVDLVESPPLRLTST